MSVTMESIHGRIIDLDSHEHKNPDRFVEALGERGQRFWDASKPIWKAVLQGDGNDLTVEADDTMEITPESVWAVKGTGAPSAQDLDRRPAVLEMMGVRRALIFPGLGMGGIAFGYGGGISKLAAVGEELQKLSWDVVDAQNEYSASYSRQHESMYMVGMLPIAKPGMTPELLVKETERLIKMGLKSFWISSGMAPCGLSPADKALDPFYALVSEANVSLVFHTGSEVGFLSSNVWRQVPQFHLHYGVQDAESHGDPYNLCNKGRAEAHWLSVAVLGGVFERHPRLRIGGAEVGTMWLGPLAEQMDFWTDRNNIVKNRWLDWHGGKDLSLKPSEYLARNVRLTPFAHEPVEMILERYPNLQDCFCFSSDFPHMEGTKWPIQNLFKRLQPFGDTVLDKFFCTNAEWICP